MIQKLRKLVKQNFRSIGLAGILLFTYSTVAYALNVTSPITATNGVVACATCVTESSVSQYGIPVWGTTQELGVITPSTETTYVLKSNGSSANPAFEALAIGDIPSGTADEWAALIGTPTGTGAFVRADGPTLTGTIDLDAGTVLLPADAVDAITEIDADLRSGDGSKLGTVDGSLTTGKQLAFDSDGNIIASNSDIGASSSIEPVIGGVSETQITAGSTTVYMDPLSGSLSTTEAEVAVPMSVGTFGKLRCHSTVTTGGSGIAITVGIAPLDTGACGTFSYTSKPTVTVTSTSIQSDTSNSAQVANAGECMVFKLVPSSTTTPGKVSCSLAKTANS